MLTNIAGTRRTGVCDMSLYGVDFSVPAFAWESGIFQKRQTRQENLLQLLYSDCLSQIDQASA